MIEARRPAGVALPTDCRGCGGKKEAPIAVVFSVFDRESGLMMALCEECGRDAANAIGYLCIRDGGWSKLEPRKRAVKRVVKRAT